MKKISSLEKELFLLELRQETLYICGYPSYTRLVTTKNPPILGFRLYPWDFPELRVLDITFFPLSLSFRKVLYNQTNYKQIYHLIEKKFKNMSKM